MSLSAAVSPSNLVQWCQFFFFLRPLSETQLRYYGLTPATRGSCPLAVVVVGPPESSFPLAISTGPKTDKEYQDGLQGGK